MNDLMIICDVVRKQSGPTKDGKGTWYRIGLRLPSGFAGSMFTNSDIYNRVVEGLDQVELTLDVDNRNNIAPRIIKVVEGNK